VAITAHKDCTLLLTVESLKGISKVEEVTGNCSRQFVCSEVTREKQEPRGLTG
jgi:hypothetical protein